MSQLPPGLAPRLVFFCEELRSEGVKIGTSEILDAFQALGEVAWTDREDFREALAATLAKSQEDRHVFEILFDRFFFNAVEAEMVDQGLKEQRFEGGDRIDIDDLASQIQEAIRAGSDGDMSDLARLAVAAFGSQGEASGVIGVDVQRIRRALDLKKPPSIAESVDWARALLLLGADDIDADTFTQTLSIIVKHRTDLDVVAERVGMKLPVRAAPAGQP